ncbi:hypothetical protein LZ30DRAFT_99514 [Colletotrichum cereale]|nr:hypothetical protein LZ30DRAFT_99514 [Colletotrichum cereale]
MNLASLRTGRKGVGRGWMPRKHDKQCHDRPRWPPSPGVQRPSGARWRGLSSGVRQEDEGKASYWASTRLTPPNGAWPVCTETPNGPLEPLTRSHSSACLATVHGRSRTLNYSTGMPLSRSPAVAAVAAAAAAARCGHTDASNSAVTVVARRYVCVCAVRIAVPRLGCKGYPARSVAHERGVLYRR